MSAVDWDRLGRSLPAPERGADARDPGTERGLRSRRVLVGALLASIALHCVLTLWPVEFASAPETPPLQATITELPPPPRAVAATPAKPKRSHPRPAPAAAPEPAPIAAAEVPPSEPAPDTAAVQAPEPAPLTGMAATAQEAPGPVDVPITPDPPAKTLPPRVDLAYTVFLGTQGFMIGDATYRFEHTGNQYRMETVGQARGLAALLIRGQGKVESRGLITASGLQPLEFAIERGSHERREVATFDWEAGVVALHEQKTEALELPTFDPLSVLWQFYFAPPSGDELTFTVATTRRVNRYTIKREGTERITWPNGEIDTELWHRRSDDGKTDGYVWLAPTLHYVPVKMRLVATNRGTIEALLASIRVDDDEAGARP